MSTLIIPPKVMDSIRKQLQPYTDDVYRIVVTTQSDMRNLISELTRFYQIQKNMHWIHEIEKVDLNHRIGGKEFVARIDAIYMQAPDVDNIRLEEILKRIMEERENFGGHSK
jgi:hypothetical protein